VDNWKNTTNSKNNVWKIKFWRNILFFKLSHNRVRYRQSSVDCLCLKPSSTVFPAKLSFKFSVWRHQKFVGISQYVHYSSARLFGRDPLLFRNAKISKRNKFFLASNLLAQFFPPKCHSNSRYGVIKSLWESHNTSTIAQLGCLGDPLLFRDAKMSKRNKVVLPTTYK
jgi:hypothetical protein